MAKKNTSMTPAKVAKLNETGTRKGKDRRKNEALAAAVAPERRKAKRRRQIDPTTCEREYSTAEIEFMHALDEYKCASGRMFPTCSEILEVFVGLGYRKVAPASECFSMQENTANGPQNSDVADSMTETEESELENQLV